MSDFEELSIEPRGAGYVLVRTDSEGRRTELALSEANVVFLARIAPQTARRIVASKMRAGGDVAAMLAAPVKDFQLNSDLHSELVLLRLRDEFEAEFDFSFTPPGARKFGERLIAWAGKTEQGAKPSKQ
jgi:hypothetical protein